MNKQIEFEDQRSVLWMRGFNYLIDATVAEVKTFSSFNRIPATRGYVNPDDILGRVEFEGREYTVLNGRAETTNGNLLRRNLNAIAGKDTRFYLNAAMKRAYEKFGGLVVEVVSINEMTYRLK